MASPHDHHREFRDWMGNDPPSLIVAQSRREFEMEVIDAFLDDIVRWPKPLRRFVVLTFPVSVPAIWLLRIALLTTVLLVWSILEPFSGVRNWLKDTWS